MMFLLLQVVQLTAEGFHLMMPPRLWISLHVFVFQNRKDVINHTNACDCAVSLSAVILKDINVYSLKSSKIKVHNDLGM